MSGGISIRLTASTLDDLLRKALRRLVDSKSRVCSTRGPNREILAAVLELTNPRARLSVAGARDIIFSCLGETLWYFGGKSDLRSIEYYIPSYRSFSRTPVGEDCSDGAYGPRLFGEKGQIEEIAELLRCNKQTRKSVVQIFNNLDRDNNDVPCTMTLQFLVRGNALNLVVNMRSNDAFRGLPHDIFAFTLIQEYIARKIGCNLGHYFHFVGSLHLYDDCILRAQDYLDEGWQVQKTASMPEMPRGDPTLGMRWLLQAEERIRANGDPDVDCLGVEPYWADLARLLKIKRAMKDGDLRTIVKVKSEMDNSDYEKVIRQKGMKIIPQNTLL